MNFWSSSWITSSLDNEQLVMQPPPQLLTPRAQIMGSLKGDHDDDDLVPWTNFHSEDYNPELFTMSEPSKTISHPSQ